MPALRHGERRAVCGLLELQRPVGGVVAGAGAPPGGVRVARTGELALSDTPGWRPCSDRRALVQVTVGYGEGHHNPTTGPPVFVMPVTDASANSRQCVLP